MSSCRIAGLQAAGARRAKDTNKTQNTQKIRGTWSFTRMSILEESRPSNQEPRTNGISEYDQEEMVLIVLDTEEKWADT